MKTSTSKANAAFQKGLIGAAGILAVLILWHSLSENYHSLILPSPKEAYAALQGMWQSGQLRQAYHNHLSQDCHGLCCCTSTRAGYRFAGKCQPFSAEFDPTVDHSRAGYTAGNLGCTGRGLVWYRRRYNPHLSHLYCHFSCSFCQPLLWPAEHRPQACGNGCALSLPESQNYC